MTITPWAAAPAIAVARMTKEVRLIMKFYKVDVRVVLDLNLTCRSEKRSKDAEKMDDG